MELSLRNRLLIASGVIAAVVMGWYIANEQFFLPALIGLTLLLWILARHILSVPADALATGFLLVGYLVGNRGFAQLHPPGLPLLPGEAVLAIAIALAIWRAARLQQIPVQKDLLNVLVLLWIAIGTVRMPLDFREYSFMAVRDFAFVYYALFFFLAQAWQREAVATRWLRHCLTTGLVLAGPVFIAFLLWPEWMVAHLSIAEVPIIFVKNDVVGGFVAGGVFWMIYRFTLTHRIGWIIAAAGALAGLGVSNNRGSILAFIVATLALPLLRAWRMLRIVGLLVGVGFLALCVQAVVSRQPITASPLYRYYESAASVLDVSGTRRYVTADLEDKPDNNQFRLVWWRAVAGETWEENRWLGLGFGHDLAAEFLRIYYGDANDEFSVRSPHNYLLSIFGRMGLLGFVAFCGVMGAMALRTWRSRHLQAEIDSPLPLWILGWTILISACFGVVLEGPMGAIVFWTVLGLANGSMPPRKQSPTVPAAIDDGASTRIDAPAALR